MAAEPPQVSVNCNCLILLCVCRDEALLPAPRVRRRDDGMAGRLMSCEFASRGSERSNAPYPRLSTELVFGGEDACQKRVNLFRRDEHFGRHRLRALELDRSLQRVNAELLFIHQLAFPLAFTSEKHGYR
jgi:hypothetical protein